MAPGSFFPPLSPRSSPRGSPRRKGAIITTDTTSPREVDWMSPGSVLDLYPVVHDLNDDSYSAFCNPLEIFSQLFSMETQEKNVATSPTRPSLPTLDETTKLKLQTPELMSDDTASNEDIVSDLPDLPTWHRERSKSYDVNAGAPKLSLERSHSDCLVLSFNSHRRARSDLVREYLKVVPMQDTMMHSQSASEHTERSFTGDYVVIRQICQCDYSAVLECINRNSGERYCVKRMDLSRKNAKEVEMLRQAQSPFTVQLVDEIQEEDNIFVVTEFLAGGNLLSRVIQKGAMAEIMVQKLALQLVKAVSHLHVQALVCHNNIHPTNILLENNGDEPCIKLVDFGAATMLDATATRSVNLSGHAPYRAPERRASAASDMWSVGVILYFCLLGHDFFSQLGNNEILDRLHKQIALPQARPALSRHAKQFLCNLIHADPDVRLMAQEALTHPWLNTEESASSTCATSSSDEEGVDTTECPNTPTKRRLGKRIGRSFSRLVTNIKRPEKQSG